jgi:xylulokinase
MEGATFSVLEGLRRLGRCGLAARELRVVGGGSRNALWRRVLADAAQLPLRFPAEPEAAALGAALQAAAVLAQVPVADFVRAHPPPLSAEATLPEAELAGAYRRAMDLHRRWGEELFGGARADA